MYSIGAVVLRSMTAVTALLVLHVLTPAEFGLLALVNTALRIVPVFLGLGLRQAFWLEYFHKTPHERKHVLNTIMVIYLCVAIPLLALGFLHADTISHYLFINQANRTIIALALGYCFLQFFSELFLQVLRYQMRALFLASIQLGAAAVTIIANLLFVFYFNWGVTGVIGANTLGIFSIVVIAATKYFINGAHRLIKLQDMPTNAKRLLILGFPFIPNIALSWLLSAGNRWILAYFTSMELVGIYALADMAGQIFVMCALEPVANAYVPYMLEQYAAHKEPINTIEHRNTRTMWWAMVGAGVLITLGTCMAFMIGPYILPAAYQQALRYVWFILFANIFLLGTYFSSCSLVFAKKSWTILWLNAVAAGTNIGLNILLVPIFGISGCVAALIGSYGLFFYLNRQETKQMVTSAG